MSHTISPCSCPENALRMKMNQTSSVGYLSPLSKFYRQSMWMRTNNHSLSNKVIKLQKKKKRRGGDMSEGVFTKLFEQKMALSFFWHKFRLILPIWLHNEGWPCQLGYVMNIFYELYKRNTFKVLIKIYNNNKIHVWKARN